MGMSVDVGAGHQFAGEEVKSDYGYPEGYRIKSIIEQNNRIQEFFPGIRSISTEQLRLTKKTLPKGAEGWFAIPKWQTLAPRYGEAVEKVLAMIASKRKFYNYRDGQLGAGYLRQHAKTVKMFQKLGDEQKDFDILVVPAQFGLRYWNCTTRMAREMFIKNEFGLGVFAVGIMLLTHPERFQNGIELNIECAGDEYNNDDGFSSALHFDVLNEGFLELDVRYFDDDDFRSVFGSASAFLPQI